MVEVDNNTCPICYGAQNYIFVLSYISVQNFNHINDKNSGQFPLISQLTLMQEFIETCVFCALEKNVFSFFHLDEVLWMMVFLTLKNRKCFFAQIDG